VKQYRATAQEFATRGFRSLGVAVKEEGRPWELLGIMAMFDPPRSDTAAVSLEESFDSIAKANAMVVV
jgi:H+-transporting ATPase